MAVIFDLLAGNYYRDPKADFGPARQDLAAGFTVALPAGLRLTSSSTCAPHERALTELGKHTHVPHNRAPASAPHTKSRADSTDGGQAPIGSIIFSLCVVRKLAVFCVARV